MEQCQHKPLCKELIAGTAHLEKPGSEAEIVSVKEPVFSLLLGTLRAISVA